MKLKSIQSILAISRLTQKGAFRLPAFLLLGSLFGCLIAISQEITLFGFGAEQSMVLEMGLASIRLFSLLVILVIGTEMIPGDYAGGGLMLIKAYPVSWLEYLLGRYQGLVLVIFKPWLFLVGIYLLVLFWGQGISSQLILEVSILLYLNCLEWILLAAMGIFFSIALPRFLAIFATVLFFSLGNILPLLEGFLGGSSPLGVGLAALMNALIPNLQIYHPGGSHWLLGENLSNATLSLVSLSSILYSLGYLFLAYLFLKRLELR